MSRTLAALTAALLLLACAGHHPAPRRSLFPSTASWKTLLGEFVVPPLAGDSRRLYAATRDEVVRALDPQTGEVAWKAEGLPGTLSAADGTLLVRGDDGTLTSLQPRSGRTRWRVQTPIGGALPAMIDGDRALLAGRGGLAAVELASGRLLWTAAGVEVTAPPARAGARLLTGESDGALRCRDRATGAVLWTLATRRALLAPPLVDPVRRRLYLGTADRRVLEARLDDGKTGWSWTVGADVADPGLLLNERVLFAPLDAVLYSFKQGGNLAWRRSLPSRPLSGPLVVDGYLVIACLEAELLAFDLQTGKPAGSVRVTADPRVVIRTAPVAVGPVLALGLSDRSVVAFPASSAALPTPAAAPEAAKPEEAKPAPEAPKVEAPPPGR